MRNAEAGALEALIEALPVGRQQGVIALVGTLAMLAEGFDLQILPYLMPQIVHEWPIGAARQGTILSAGYMGMMAGFLLLGSLATRVGLKRMVAGCLLVMAALNLATALAVTPAQLIALRVAVGLTLGGVVPPTIALVSEYFPNRLRASIVTFAYIGTPIGFLVAGWAAWSVLPVWGWRGGFLIGALLPLATALLLLMLWPEAISVLRRRDRATGGARIGAIATRLFPHARLEASQRTEVRRIEGQDSVPDLFRGDRGFGTLMLWMALSLNAIVYFFVLSWLPLILVRVGASQQNAILGTAFANAGGILASLIMGPLMDRFGRYSVVTLTFVAGAFLAIAVGLLLSPHIALILPFSFGLGYCVSALQKGVSALGVFFYPPHLRSTGLGWIFGVGRSGAIVGPILAGALMAVGWRPGAIFYLMAAPMLVGAMTVTGMARRYHADRRPTYLQESAFSEGL